jgi:hypothetical protein
MWLVQTQIKFNCFPKNLSQIKKNIWHCGEGHRSRRSGSLLRQPFKNKCEHWFLLYLLFSDMAEQKMISFIFSIYTIFALQNKTWTPIYKTNLGRGSPHMFALLRKAFHQCWDTLSNNYFRNPNQKKELFLIIHFSEWLKTKSMFSIWRGFTFLNQNK